MKLRNRAEHPLSFHVDGVHHKADPGGDVTPDIPEKKHAGVIRMGVPVEAYEPPAVEASSEYARKGITGDLLGEATTVSTSDDGEEPESDANGSERVGRGRRRGR